MATESGFNFDAMSGIYANTPFTNSTGNAGTISINTPSLALLDGGRISSSSRGSGQGGLIVLDVDGVLEVKGFTAIPNSLETIDSLITAQSTSSGDAGEIIINVRGLDVQNRGYISVESNGIAGDGGDITINASDWIEIIGRDPIYRPEDDGVTGISSTISGAGQGGNIVLNTQRLFMSEEAFVTSSTFGSGNAGNIRISATDSVEIQGQKNEVDGFNTFVSANAGRATGDQPLVLGRGGEVTVTTPNLLLSDGAQLNARSRQGVAGNLTIDANFIRLTNGSRA